jgi:tRNA threonylcarbamoyladenosine modification (KEOPS) complex  Pcc1 subunit
LSRNNSRENPLKAEITLTYRAVREAEAIAKAVSPDNVKVPPGLSVKTVRRKNKVFTQIECATRLQTFIATIDDLLSHVSVAEKTLFVLKQ